MNNSTATSATNSTATSTTHSAASANTSISPLDLANEPLAITTEALLPPQNANPLLTSLHEIGTPADINWWPQTLGWQLLLLLFFCYVLYRVYLRVNNYLSNAYRRAALVELNACAESPEDYARVSHILRRTALYAFERKDVSPLIGQHWENWLDQQCQGSQFSAQYAGLISQLAYAPPSSLSAEKLSAFKSHVIYWVKNHRGYYG